MTIQVSPTQLATSKASERSASLTGLLHLRPSLNLQGFSAETVTWLQDVRDRATARVQELAIPSTRDEEWRFTDLSPLLQVNFQVASLQPTPVGPSEIESLLLPEAATTRLVFVNGVYAPELSAVDNLPVGVVVSNLTQAESLRSRLVDRLARQQGAEETFTALNTASFVDAALIWVPKNQVVETPIQLLFISTATDTPGIAHPRCLVIAEANSSLTLVEEYVSLNQSVYFTNPVTEIWVDENAQVNHTRVQRDNATAFHIGKTAVSQARDSRYACHAISLGALLSRHHLEVYQTGEQTDTTLNGLTVLAGEQVGDTHSTIAYTKPHGTSNQVHKCIVNDRAHAVFNGRIFVPKLAQMTDAAQLSRNLLLSPKARVDTKPQLEITADNVKCAHGATVSQLDDEEVFYLQSRGLSQADARKLLIYAFAIEGVNQIPVASVRDTLAAVIRAQQT